MPHGAAGSQDAETRNRGGRCRDASNDTFVHLQVYRIVCCIQKSANFESLSVHSSIGNTIAIFVLTTRFESANFIKILKVYWLIHYVPVLII